MSSSPSELAAMQANLRSNFYFLPNLDSEMTAAETDEAISVSSGLKTSMFNIICPKREMTKEALSKEVDQFALQNLPFAVWITPDANQAKMGQILEELGIPLDSTESAMILRPDEYSEPKRLNQSLTIKRVRTPEDLKLFAAVIRPYDSIAASIFERQADRLEQIDKLFPLYVGIDSSGEPVVTGSLALFNECAAIFNLITKAEARKQGYGTTMMHHLVEEAIQTDPWFITLSCSSDEAKSVYSYLGFSTVAEYHVYEKSSE
ncbi:MAG: hypothetical protein S4CHLAM102_02140 [Chlamydiia bacterium]|nr:hypothetical protein [Chlamydiia bacterium]